MFFIRFRLINPRSAQITYYLAQANPLSECYPSSHFDYVREFSSKEYALKELHAPNNIVNSFLTRPKDASDYLAEAIDYNTNVVVGRRYSSTTPDMLILATEVFNTERPASTDGRG